LIFAKIKPLDIKYLLQVLLYKIVDDESDEKLAVEYIENFECSALQITIREQNLYCAEGGKIKIRTFQGCVKQIISMPESEGEPIMMDINNSWLCIINSNGYIRIYDLSSGEVRQQCNSKYIPAVVENFRQFLHVKINGTGNRVSFTYFVGDEEKVSPSIMIWDAETDRVSKFNFLTGMTDQQQFDADAEIELPSENRPTTAAVRKIKKEQKRFRLLNHLPGTLCWDSNDPRYLICEANPWKANMVQTVHCAFIVSAALFFFITIMFQFSESVWEHMAQMCVKTQRLDIALICLGKMKHASGARALRISSKNNDPHEVQVAILAIQLGLLVTQELFYKCKRYDLVNRLLQTRNRWDEAIQFAQNNDRIHLRNTYYNYAKHLESLGLIDKAIENYEKSGMHRFEVPRMLFNEPKMLEAYIKKTKDPLWWAQYMESQNELKVARLFYQYTNDYLSIVRLLCYSNDIDEAVEVANNSDNKAACYYLGQYFEAHMDPKKAVAFFTKACAYSNALRLAKEHCINEEIANLALMAGGNEIVEAAQYYENIPGQADKAVMLYHKAGMINRALDLAFRTEQFSALDLISNDLDQNSDPQTLQRAAEFFQNNQQFDKAVQLLAYAKNAVNLCKEKNVPLSETLAEKLTPSKENITNEADRIKLLESIAECCLHQRNYHFAAKKYTQAGNKLKISFFAMQSLIKSADTPKIIFFASTAKNKEIYILAANYLQTLNWKENGDLMKRIESFYSKANAHEHLATFYEACAEVEIDDYRDYSKAMDALIEAMKYLTKYLVLKVITEEMLKLQNAFCFQAYSLIQQLKEREPQIKLSQFVNQEIQNIICDELKIPRISDTNSTESEWTGEDEIDGEDVDYSYEMKRRIQSNKYKFDKDYFKS
uniref:Intraflagellar transport protein 122 homolog n=1 Tax=Thelazia callipaeda TaxID=103827 RepID=A0A0N5CXM8_THECL